MSGKELLALLLMILPSVIATALVTFALVQHPEVAPEARTARQDAQAAERPGSAARAATQKRMRDPWEKAVYSKTSSAPRTTHCDPDTGSQDMLCFYW